LTRPFFDGTDKLEPIPSSWSMTVWMFVIAVSTNAAVDKLQQADQVIDHVGQLSNFMPM
jgi:hypothetical protein